MRMQRVLVVEDDDDSRGLLARELTGAGAHVTDVGSVKSALIELSRAHYDVALVDMRLDDGSGHLVLAEARALSAPPVVVMMSGHADVTSVVAALRDGAADFLEKPIALDDLVARLDRAFLATTEGGASRAPAKTALMRPPSARRSMIDTLGLADRVAATPSCGALLVGESGSGKEVLATRIHERSSRREKSFVRVNVAAIPSSIFQAELFGSVRGAFTDAKIDRSGYMKSADGGTILLDEIGELGLDDQAKLLRVLEERTFFPIGSDREHTSDVRVIAATNRDPRVMLQEGRLRTDLFFRLGTVIEIPPLRDRPNEILPLALRFIEVCCREFSRRVCELTPDAVALLESHSWPGNIRHLRNAIERAIMLTDGDTLDADAFQLAKPSDSPLERGLHAGSADAVEREAIVKVLASATSRVDAARVLGISRSTLYEKLKRHNLTSATARSS